MNDKFCLIPWTHLHTWPNGNTYMCCVSDNGVPIGVLSDDNTLKDLWNSPKIRENRLKMLRGEEVKECHRCYDIEKLGGGSLRMDHNYKFSHHLPLVDTTLSDGTVEKLNMPYIDFRFSNFCNLRCRTCGPDLSSKWAKDSSILSGGWNTEQYKSVIRPNISPEIFWDEIESVLPSVERIYFAGGEPLIMEEHYRLLDKLIENGMTNVGLTYNTNFSSLRYKDKNVVDYWNKFSEVTICASLDSWGSRAEYIRKDLKWNIVENNFREVQEKCPHVMLDVGLTLSIFNFYTLVEYYDYMTENKLISHNGMNISIVTDPVHYKPSCIPIEHRREIAAKYQDKLDYLDANKLCGETMKDRWRLAINYVLLEEDNTKLPYFVEITKKLDIIRNENITEIFPELKFLFDE